MNVFLMLAALSALAAIACEERLAGRHPAFYLLKPLTTLLILGAAWLAPDADPAYRAWICAGLVLSMLGDIALMFEGNAAFIAGLGSFLLAHGLFILALLSGVSPHWPPWWSVVPAAAGLIFFAWLLPRTGPLLLPVCVYGLTLLIMALVAATRAELRQDLSGWLASLGAVVFLLSDSCLAVRKFHGPYARAQAAILSSYWLAIGLLAASVAGSGAIALS